MTILLMLYSFDPSRTGFIYIRIYQNITKRPQISCQILQKLCFIESFKCPISSRNVLTFRNFVISFSGEADRKVVAYQIGWHMTFRDVLGISCIILTWSIRVDEYGVMRVGFVTNWVRSKNCTKFSHLLFEQAWKSIFTSHIIIISRLVV